MMIWFVVLLFILIVDYITAVLLNRPTPSGAYLIFHSAKWFAFPHMLLIANYFFTNSLIIKFIKVIS